MATATKGRPQKVRITGYLVQSRVVADKDGFGHRFSGGKVRWGKWRTWNQYIDNILNIRASVREAKARLSRKHQGTVLYIRPVINNLPSDKTVPIFEAKWGHDGVPYLAWKDNPAAYYWQRRVKMARLS